MGKQAALATAVGKADRQQKSPKEDNSKSS